MSALLSIAPAWARLLALLALAAALWGHGYATGTGREADRRDASALADERQAAADYQAAVLRGNGAARAYIDAYTRRDAQARALERRLDHERERDLVTPQCGPAAVPAPVAGGAAPQAALRAADPPAPAGVRFSPRFVGLWNAAFSAPEAPVPADPGGAPGAAWEPGVLGPDARAVLGNHTRNAAGCAHDRARLAALIELLRARQPGAPNP